MLERHQLAADAAAAVTVIAESYADEPGERAAIVSEARTQRPSGPIAAAWTPAPAVWLSEPPPARRWLLRHPTRDGQPCAPGQGDGVLPLGRCGGMAGAGGIGKSMLGMQLAASVATGRPWLGHFEVSERGRVLLGLAEENSEECHRRLFRIANALQLDQHERDALVARLVVLPLMGKRCNLVHVDHRERVTTTAAFGELRQLLHEHTDWRLVVLDPLSRWLPGAESSNDAATTAITIAESLCEAPGNPTVLISAHSSKMARRMAQADVRGVTGQTDAWRHVFELTAKDGGVELAQAKANYSAPWAEPLLLARERGGVLRVVPPAELEARAEQAAEERAHERAEGRRQARQREHQHAVAAVVAAVRETGRKGVKNIDAMASRLGLTRTACRSAFADAIEAGQLVRDGAATRSRIVLPIHAEDTP